MVCFPERDFVDNFNLFVTGNPVLADQKTQSQLRQICMTTIFDGDIDYSNHCDLIIKFSDLCFEAFPHRKHGAVSENDTETAKAIALSYLQELEQEKIYFQAMVTFFTAIAKKITVEHGILPEKERLSMQQAFAYALK